MASVHLSISKHSQLSSLSTGGEVIPFLFSPWHHCTLCLSSFLLPPSAPAFSPVSFIYSPLSFYIPPLLSFIFFQHSPSFFPTPLHPSPRHPLLPPPLLVVSYALSGTVHSATKQSCLQQHTLANQARPEFSSPQIHSTTP